MTWTTYCQRATCLNRSPVCPSWHEYNSLWGNHDLAVSILGFSTQLATTSSDMWTLFLFDARINLMVCFLTVISCHIHSRQWCLLEVHVSRSFSWQNFPVSIPELIKPDWRHSRINRRMNSKTPPVPVISEWQAFLFVKSTLADGTPRQSVLGLLGGPVNPRAADSPTLQQCCQPLQKGSILQSSSEVLWAVTDTGNICQFFFSEQQRAATGFVRWGVWLVCGVWLFSGPFGCFAQEFGQRTGSQAPAPQWTKVPWPHNWASMSLSKVRLRRLRFNFSWKNTKRFPQAKEKATRHASLWAACCASLCWGWLFHSASHIMKAPTAKSRGLSKQGSTFIFVKTKDNLRFDKLW